MKYNEAATAAAKKLNLPKEVVINTYKAYWKFIKDSIEELPLKKSLSEEDFNSLHTSINVPSLGKLNCTYNKYIKLKHRFNIINKIKE